MNSPSNTLSADKQLLLREFLRGNAAQHRAAGDSVQPRGPNEAVPLSAEQRHVWLHASLAAEVPLYNEAFTIHRRGPFDLSALQHALNEFIRRHEIWRTAFEEEAGMVRTRVLTEVRVELPFTDLAHLAEADREQAALRLATDDARRPFDLASPPLLRGRVVRMAGDAHRLYLALHHLIFDGVSIYRVLMPELAALYEAFRAARRPALPAPRLQYADYTAWRTRELQGDAIAGALDYWRHKLSGELSELDLPVDRPGSARPSYRGDMETFALSPELSAALRDLAARLGCTLYAVLLAAFKVLLHRYSGQRDIVIGGLTDMRRRPELQSVVGYFLNGLALRTEPSPQMAFEAYLLRVQSTIVEALDNAAAPLDLVIREIRPRRAGSRNPLFNVLFSIQPPTGEYADGWDLTQMDVAIGTAKFDLYLELEEAADRILGRFLYSTELFEPATIRRMIGHWTSLLAGVTRDPHCRIADLPLLTEGEQRELLGRLNDTWQPYPNTTLPAWFEAQVQKTPDAIAIEGNDLTWRYRELWQRVDALTRRLQRAGIGCETLVGIAMDRSPAMVVALLAILRAGGAYLPLDPDLPPARLELLINDASPPFVVTELPLVGRLPRSKARILLYDDTPEWSAVSALVDAIVGPANLAYVLYTSGSTGRPKAVEIEHRAVVNLLAAMQQKLALGADDAVLAVTTLSFDIAGLELFLPLVSGARLVIATRQEASDPAKLGRLLEYSRCTVMQATPATWRGLVATGWPGGDRLKILCGGEALQADLAQALLQRCGRLWNMYGPTETTIWSLSHEVRAGDNPVPIGRPLANTRVHVLDRNGAPVPAGVPGELFIAGDGLARGYRNDRRLTDGKFVRLPPLADERLYRTGDVVKYRADGVIEFVGRIDNQVKVRGFRVGLEEIEACLVSHPAVRASAVCAFPDTSGELGLAAFVVRHDPHLETDDLREFLRRRLPDYMVPNRLAVVRALPTTPNGKIDRKRLAALDVERAPRAHAAARDALEARLTCIWQDLFQVDEIGIHDNFFDLGGHSLLAVMLLARIKEALGRDVPLSALFQAPTIAGLADALRTGYRQSFSHLVRLRSGTSGRPLFIVHGIFGNVLQLEALARAMRTERPLYALQARGADLEQEPHATIAEMADAYMAAIRTVQPQGPYALAGYSFGGLIAFEMARQFRLQSEEIELLALFETDLYDRYLPLLDAIAYRCRLIGRVVAKAREMPMRQLPVYLQSKLQKLWIRMLVRLGLRDYPVTIDEAPADGPFKDRLYAMYQLGARAFFAFNPKPYDRTISVFRVTRPRYEVCDPLPIWRRIARAVEVYDIEGDHDTIMYEPHVRSLAAQLSRCLASLETRE